MARTTTVLVGAFAMLVALMVTAQADPVKLDESACMKKLADQLDGVEILPEMYKYLKDLDLSEEEYQNISDIVASDPARIAKYQAPAKACNQLFAFGAKFDTCLGEIDWDQGEANKFLLANDKVATFVNGVNACMAYKRALKVMANRE